MGRLDEWYKKIAAYKEKRKAGTLTKEEEEDWDFMEQKIDDWNSDYDMPEGG